MQSAALEDLSPEELELCWCGLKADENDAKKRRLQIEDLIMHKLGDSIKGRGTTNLSHVKVTTGVSKSYDQAQLEAISRTVTGELFPFKLEFKEDSAGLRFIKENNPEIWGLIKTAMIEKPKKAAFSVLPAKEKSA